MLKLQLSRCRLEIFALIFIVYLLNSCCNAAPTQESSRILRRTDGCYYNYNHYGEGDRIQTNEPCLNCTCHNQMLMCYLRVCPFTKPIDHDCIIEKREDQCCPIITCPEVPVQLMDNQISSTDVGLPERSGCIIDDKFYPEGRQVPSNPNKPCELCYCIRNKTSCIVQECTLHIDGCQPIYNKGSCCPVRYNCDNEIENELLLEQDTTTVRPTPGFMITTPLSYLEAKECVHNGATYADGSIIESDRPCEHCYCMKGDIVCAVQECANPIEVDKQNCVSTPSPTDSNECCPKQILCDDVVYEEYNTTTTATSELFEIKKILTTTVSSVSEDLLTTHQPSWDDNLIDGISSEDLQLQEHINEDGHMKQHEFDATLASATTIPPSVTDAPEISKTTTESKEKYTTAKSSQDTSDDLFKAGVPAEDNLSSSSVFSSESPLTTESELQFSSDSSSKSSILEEGLSPSEEVIKSSTVISAMSPWDDSTSKSPVATDNFLKERTTISTFVKSAEESMLTTQSSAINESNLNKEQTVSGSNLPSPDFTSPIINEIPDSIPGEGHCLVKGVTYKSYDPVINDCNLPCICLNSLIVCKSNCNKSPSCPVLGQNLNSCCSSIKCDYDIIEPLDRDEVASTTQVNLIGTTIETTIKSNINDSISSTETITMEKTEKTTERLDTFEGKETSKLYEASTTTKALSDEMESSSTSSQVSEMVEESEIKHPEKVLDLSTMRSEEIEHEMDKDKVENVLFSAATETSTPLETERHSTPGAILPDFLTEDTVNESHPFEGFSIRDSITEEHKFESHITTEAALNESHISSTSNTLKPEVPTDIEKSTTISDQKENTSEQGSTTFRSGSSSASVSDMIEKMSSEIPFRKQTISFEDTSMKDDVNSTESISKLDKPMTTVMYPEVSVSEFTEGAEVNETDVKNIEIEDEIKIMEMSTTTEQLMSTESASIKIRKEDENSQMSTETFKDVEHVSTYPAKEKEEEIKDLIGTTSGPEIESSSSPFLEDEKTFGYKMQESDEFEKFSTEKPFLTSIMYQEETTKYDIRNDTVFEDMKISHEVTTKYDIQNDTVFEDMKTDKLENQDFINKVPDNLAIASSPPSTDKSVEEEYNETTLKPLKVSTESFDIEEMSTRMFTPETSILENEKEEQDQKEIELQTENTTTENQAVDQKEEVTDKKYPTETETEKVTTEKQAEDQKEEGAVKIHPTETETEKVTTEKQAEDQKEEGAVKIHPAETEMAVTEKQETYHEDKEEADKKHPTETGATVTEKQEEEPVHVSHITEQQEDLEVHHSLPPIEEQVTESKPRDTETEQPQEIDIHSSTKKQEELEPYLTTESEVKTPEIQQPVVTDGPLEAEQDQFTKSAFEISSSQDKISTEPAEAEVSKDMQTEKSEILGSHQGTFEESTESKIVELSTSKSDTREPEGEELEENIIKEKFTTISQTEQSTTIKIINNEIIEQSSTMTPTLFSSSFAPSSTAIPFIPHGHDAHQSTTESSTISDSRTTERVAVAADHTEDHSEISTQKSPLPSNIDNMHYSTKAPSYQQNLPQFPPQHYPTYSEDDYNEEEESESFGPGTCRYGGKLFVSAQQIPRDDPCDFCFCFRSDIICLQQSCPPPISGCHEEPIQGFCCPRYECPVSLGTQLNITTSTTTTTTLPPHLMHNLLHGGELIKTGCYIGGKSYRVGDRVDSTSGPCMNCRCGGDGQMKCEPKPCTPEPMLRQMIAVVASRKR